MGKIKTNQYLIGKLYAASTTIEALLITASRHRFIFIFQFWILNMCPGTATTAAKYKATKLLNAPSAGSFKKYFSLNKLTRSVPAN